MGEWNTLPSLLSSQANNLLPNGMKNSPVLPFPPTPVLNGAIYPALTYTSDSFPTKSFSVGLITAIIEEVGGIDFLLVNADKTTKYAEPLSDKKEDGECLF